MTSPPPHPDTIFPPDTGPDSPYWDAPAPIAYSLIEMMREPLLNSADELLLVLETCLRHLGWLWLAEYLHSDHHDPTLDRLLFKEILEGHRELSVGGWAYLGSRLSYLFQHNAWTCKIPILQAFDYGHPRDKNSLLSQLLRYRNSFAHGSFDAQLHDIIEHRKQLWTLLWPMLPLLRDVPIVFWDPAHNVVRQANGHWSERPDLPRPSAPPYHPHLLCPSGEMLALHPMYAIVRHADNGNAHHIYSHIPDVPTWSLETFSLHDATPEQRRDLFARNPHVFAYLHTFERQRQGFLSLAPIWKQAQLPPVVQDEATNPLPRLAEQLIQVRPSRPNFVLVVGYPGSGKTGLVAHAPAYALGFHHLFRYRIEEEHPSASATTFLRYLLRQLDEPVELSDSSEALSQQWLQALDQCRHRNRRVLLCIDQFHQAYRAYQDETESIADVLSRWRGPASEALSVLLTARPGYQSALLHDERLELPPPTQLSSERCEELLAQCGLTPTLFPPPSVPSFTAEERAFRRAVLFVLSAAPRALTAWEVDNILDRLLDQKPDLFPPTFLFSPRIERTLWELRPLLLWETSAPARLQERSKAQAPSSANAPPRERRYQPFSPALRAWLQHHLAP